MKIIHRLWSIAGLPCRECGGRGYVIDSDVVAFIERNSLALYQAADTLMANEIVYGALGSLPVSAWEEVGLSEDQALDFATDVGHAHKIHSCPTCNGQANHPDALAAATAVINSHRADDRRRYAEWQASLAPEDRQRKRPRIDSGTGARG